MKRFFSICLAVIVLFTLCSCGNGITERTRFYYRRAAFLYGEESPVIGSESRDITGHEDELSYLISLYLAGPVDKKLISPFPSGTELKSVQQTNNVVKIELSDLDIGMSDSEFTLACACLTLTSLEFVSTENISITSGERSLTMNRNSLLLYDNTASTETMEASE